MFLLKELRHFYFARTGHYYFAVTIKTSHNLYYVKPRPKLDMFIWRRSSMRPQSTPTSFRGVLRHHWGVFCDIIGGCFQNQRKRIKLMAR